jgi:hypothetical protein
VTAGIVTGVAVVVLACAVIGVVTVLTEPRHPRERRDGSPQAAAAPRREDNAA